ncbi:carbohydrate-binding domain-containing protein [Verrucomicrobiota bacterium]
MTFRRLVADWAGYAVAGGFVLVCAAIARRSGATLTPTRAMPAAQYPYVLRAEEMLENVPASVAYVQRIEGGMRVYEDAWFGYSLEFPESGEIPVFAVARGTPAGGFYPSVALRIDGEFEGSFFCTSDDWGLYRTFISLSKGIRRFELAHLADNLFFPEDRNLDLKVVSIGAPPPDADKYYRWTAPVLIPPERMSHQVCGEVRQHRFRLWDGGWIGDDVYFAEPGSYRVGLRAAKWGETGPPAMLRVTLDNDLIGEFTVPGGDYSLFEADCLILRAGLCRMSIHNRSESAPSGDVIIDGIAVGAYLSAGSARGKAPDVGRAPAVLGSSDWDYVSGGGPYSEGMALWTRGCLRKEVRCSREFRGSLAVAARGEACEGEWPSLLVMVDTDQITRFQVDTTNFRPYLVHLELPAGRHLLTLAFENDLFLPGRCDRNLFLREVTVAPGNGVKP